MGEIDEQSLPGAPIRPHPARLSSVLERLAAEATGPVSIANIRDVLGDRSFATLLLFFALINLLPLPPGASAILGLPLIILSAQMVYGSETVWLPRRVLDRTFTVDQFRASMGRLVPWLVWLEKFIRPRYWPFWTRQGERIVGIAALVLSVVVTLPIPLGNWLPALAVSLIAFAVSERDGVVLAFGLLVGALSILIVALVLGSAGALVGFVWDHAALPW